jgi:hypothetical protein
MTYLVRAAGYPRAWLLCGLALASGCGVISNDTQPIDVSLQDKSFTVDASAWGVDDAAVASYLAQSCASAPSLCRTAAAQACDDTTCSGVCGDDHVCDLALAISLWRPVDLVTEVPAVNTVSSTQMLDVTIDAVTYEVLDNSLNVDTPALTVYIGPSSATAPGDPGATAIGTISAVAAGGITDGPTMLDFDASGRQALSDALAAYDTPFNLIVGASLTVTADDPVPTGKLDAVVHVTAHAGL